MIPLDEDDRAIAPLGAGGRLCVEAIVVRWIGEKIECRFRIGSLERTVLARPGAGLLRNGIYCHPGDRVHLTGYLWSEHFVCVWVGAGRAHTHSRGLRSDDRCARRTGGADTEGARRA